MPKLGTQTFDLLQDGQYVLRIEHIGDAEFGEYAGEKTCQIIATLEVREVLTNGNELMSDGTTEAVGHVYDEYWSLDPNQGTVKKGSKMWLIYEAATGQILDTDDEIDTDDMIGKEFQARIVPNNPGTRNRTEHDTFKKVKKAKKSGATKEEATAAREAVEDGEANLSDFDDLPF